jgi:methyltransferase (TIGR00027 family)
LGTARWVAAARARESRRPDRLFFDPWAEQLAGPSGALALAASEQASGIQNAYLPVRTRFFDDALVDASWADQVVLLGAGMDTRAHRLSWAAGSVVFEVDHPQVLEAKRRVLSGVTVRCARREVGVDLAHDWSGALVEAGLDSSRPTMWVAEGLFFYLTAPAVTALLSTAGLLSRARARFAADMFGSGLLRLPTMKAHLDSRERQGRPAPFTCDDPEGLFGVNGWTTGRIVQPGDWQASYGRLPTRSQDRHLPSSPAPRTYLVVADGAAPWSEASTRAGNT